MCDNVYVYFMFDRRPVMGSLATLSLRDTVSIQYFHALCTSDYLGPVTVGDRYSKIR